MKFLWVMLLAGKLMASEAAILDQRCAHDSLSPEQAIGRLKWSKKCNLISARQVDFYLHDENGVVKPRPIYNTYVTADAKGSWIAPFDENAPCVNPPAHTPRLVLCTSSCYLPTQKILFSIGEVRIFDAQKNNLREIMVVSPESTLDNLSYVSAPVASYSKDIMPANQVMMEIKTESGKVAHVTTNHPLLTSAGYLKEASDLKVGEDHLLSKEGGIERITSLRKYDYFGKVYNVKPQTENLNSHLVVAEGLLMGSSFYQNDGVVYLNRQLMRDSLDVSML